MEIKDDFKGNHPFYNPFDVMSFSYNKCFLCGGLLKDEGSIEHVFPKWLQNEYELWDQTISLLNGTTISYRKLTIPCCQSCNIKYLSVLENAIKLHHEKGYSEFLKLDKFRIYRWITKIFYGLLFKELSLLTDQTDPKQGPITSPKLLEEFKTLHGFLQSIRFPFRFMDFHPWSIFVVETHAYGDKRDFDYHDGIFTLTFSIRMGGIGVIACLEDNGAQEAMFSEYFDKFRGIKLHPLQFDELAAKVTYKSSLMNRVPKYISVLPKGKKQEVTVTSLPLHGFSSKSIFDDWDNRTYARLLAHYWQKWAIRFTDIFKEPNLVLSLTENEDGTVKVLDPNGNIAGNYKE